MRTFLRSKVKLLVIAFAVVLAIPAIALADNVQNDVTAGGNDTITTATSTTINYRIIANNGDGQTGCNAADTSAATLNINAPSGVTATPTSRTFTSCGTNQSVQFSSSTAGDYTITVSVSDSGTGTYNTSPATFTLHVTNPPPPPNDPPTLTLPGPQTVQATGPNGAVVNYTASASDPEDGALTPNCAPASGTTFPLGITQVNCSVTDSGGASATGFFDVTVVDTTAPSLNLSNQTAEATGPNGAAVTFSPAPSASDTVDGPITPNCDAASGSTFPVGTTTVHCSAADAHGNQATGSFTVTVQDTTAPALTVPGNKTVEATGPSGAAVNFTATANDIVDGPITPNCDAASGSTFPVGTTTVHCSATDAHGNQATGSFTVTVQDTTPPTLTLPDDKTVEATKAAGADVSYTATASDLVDSSVSVTCTPASPHTFGFGTTTVDCSATDAHGNTANGSFTVLVQDTTAPVIASHGDVSATATSANGANVSYTSPGTTDAVDGPGTANCTPASGTPFALGSTTVTCSATDAHGNTATSTFKVNVTVSASDFLQPINTDDSSIFKQGSTVPVKFQLTGASAGIQNAVANLRISKVNNNILGDEVEAITTTPASTGSLFRYDATSDQYIYNWGTKSYSAGTYQLRIDLGDGVGTRTVLISLKK